MTLEQNTIFYAFSKGFCRVLLTLYNRLHIKNVPALPEGRPVIVASNHNSNLDPVSRWSSLSEEIEIFSKRRVVQGAYFKLHHKALGSNSRLEAG